MDAGVDAGSEQVAAKPAPPPAAPDAGIVATGQPAPAAPALDWRHDPTVKRHPGSYLGGGLGYVQSRSWFVPQEDEYDDPVDIGPLHGWGAFFRVGDAFLEWLALGFQIDMTSSISGDARSIAAFGLLLDITFYPWKGFGIRPSVGVGFSYATGKADFEIGYGSPLDVSLALLYEFRLSRLFAVAPIAQVYWVTGEDYDGLFLFFGLELIKWFEPKKQADEAPRP